MSRIPDDLAIRYGAILDEFEGALKTLNSSKSSTLEDLRSDLRKLGMVGAEISTEIAMLKGAVKLARMTETERQKSDEKDDGVADYVNILALARVRAHVRDEEHDAETGVIIEPEAAMLPQTGGRISAPATSAEQVAVESSAINSPDGASEKVGGFPVPAAPSSRGGTGGEEGDQTSQPVNVGGSPDATAGETATLIPEPEAIPPVADPATVASVTGDGERTASSPDAFPGATDHSKPNPWCLDPEECGLSSWEHFCLRCQRVKAERQSEGVWVQ